MSKKLNPINKEFQELTAHMSIPMILVIFNSKPQLPYRLGELQVSKSAVKSWLASPGRSYARNMDAYKLEVFKAKAAIMRQRKHKIIL